jgi:hypothetical protein
MAFIKGMQWNILWAYNNQGSKTAEVNFGAQPTLAQITLGQTAGGGLINSGIRAYRTRPTPTGPETPIDFGPNFYDWPNTVYKENLSSVTFQLALGQNQEATGVWNLFFWSS